MAHSIKMALPYTIYVVACTYRRDHPNGSSTVTNLQVLHISGVNPLTDGEAVARAHKLNEAEWNTEKAGAPFKDFKCVCWSGKRILYPLE